MLEGGLSELPAGAKAIPELCERHVSVAVDGFECAVNQRSPGLGCEIDPDPDLQDFSQVLEDDHRFNINVKLLRSRGTEWRNFHRGQPSIRAYPPVWIEREAKVRKTDGRATIDDDGIPLRGFHQGIEDARTRERKPGAQRFAWHAGPQWLTLVKCR